MKKRNNSITAEGRAYFEGSLARFGLTSSQHVHGGLQVPANAKISLNRYTNDNGNHMVFQTNDLTQFKFWVGTPDLIYKNNNEFEEYSNLDVQITKKKPHELKGKDWNTLYSAARCYIWGPSYKVSKFKGIIEGVFSPMETIVHIYTDLVVGGAMDLRAEKSSIIIANSIEILATGQILADNLTIYATVINRNYQ